MNDQSTKTSVREVKRHPLAIAWDEWLASGEGQKSADFYSLKAISVNGGTYLENRLHRAFDAGAAARPGVSDADKEHTETALALFRQLVTGKNALRELEAFACNEAEHDHDIPCECFWEQCEAWAKADIERLGQQ